MNGEQGLDLSDVSPSWMEDGLGIVGEQPDFVEEELQDWDLNCETRGGEPGDDYNPPC